MVPTPSCQVPNLCSPRSTRRVFILPAIFLLASLISGCTSRQMVSPAASQAVGSTPNATAPIFETITPGALAATPSSFPATEAAPQTSPPPVASPAARPETRSRITLRAVFNYDAHHVAVDEQIDYNNNTSAALPDLLLVIEPLRYPGTFQLNTITWKGGAPVENLTWENNTLRLPLSQPLEPGGQVSLAITYELFLPEPVQSALTRPVPFGHTARQTNLVDWYPFIPPYQPGSGWLAHPPGYFGEHQVYETTDFDVEIEITGGRQDLKVAASAPAAVNGTRQSYHLDAARSFAWSVSHEYEVYTTTVEGVEVLSYAFPVHRQGGRDALQAAAQALAIYNRLFGDYPDHSLSVVEADFLDGMEYSGLFFLSYGFYNTYQGSPGDYLIAIAAHETAHQWWYGRVGNDQALEPWLDEALCTYSERLFYENAYPDALVWWWAYRVNYYEPRGWVDGGIYSFSGDPQPYRAYRDAVYLNGAKFLEELRSSIGDTAFFAFLRDYYTQNNDRIATAGDFFRILGQHTTQDLSPLITQYFHNR